MSYERKKTKKEGARGCVGGGGEQAEGLVPLDDGSERDRLGFGDVGGGLQAHHQVAGVMTSGQSYRLRLYHCHCSSGGGMLISTTPQKVGEREGEEADLSAPAWGREGWRKRQKEDSVSATF